MKGERCINCGDIILEGSQIDPYICRDCENMLISDGSGYSPIKDM